MFYFYILSTNTDIYGTIFEELLYKFNKYNKENAPIKIHKYTFLFLDSFINSGIDNVKSKA